jgi:hypothetical protein
VREVHQATTTLSCGIISGMPAKTAMYLFQTPAGLLKIRQFNGGQWRMWAEDEFLGSFVSPEAAVQALIDGTCSLVAGGRKTRIDVPPDLSDWVYETAR